MCITNLSFETHLASSISAHFIVASSDATQAFRNSETLTNVTSFREADKI